MANVLRLAISFVYYRLGRCSTKNNTPWLLFSSTNHINNELSLLQLMDSFYHFKHWLLTILVAPVFLVISFSISDKSFIPNFIQIYFISLVVGFIFSTPAFLFYCVIFYIALDRVTSVLIMKTLMNLTAITGLLSTLYFMFDSLDREVSIPYTVAIILSSLFLKITKKENSASSGVIT